MNPIHESTNGNFSKENTDADGNTRGHELSPTISLLDSKHDGTGTIAADTMFPVSERTVGWVENSKATRSLSSSSSDSSLEDLFQVDHKSHISPISSPKPHIDVHIETPKAEKPGSWSPGATSSPMWTNGMSTTQFPPMQVMDRTAGYDPNRLPSSIFARNSSNSMGWSITSNESLFSLNFGTNSFARDHSLMFDDLQNGEYSKSDELHEPDHELNWFGQPHPPPLEEENGLSDDDKGEVEDKSEEKGVISDEEKVSAKVVRDETAHEVKLPSPHGSSNSNSPTVKSKPDGGGGSGSTKPDVFSRKKKSAWRFCQCTNCRWNFFYGFKRKQKPCSISSEENLKNEETRSSRNGSPDDKKASEKPSDSESSQKPNSRKSCSSSFLTRPCSFWFCC